MRPIEGFRAFCEELASDSPAPGGGAASAAAGAMASALLAMVCRISLRSKKIAESWPELRGIGEEVEKAGSDLIELAEKDADSYDLLVVASRKLRRAPSDPVLAAEHEDALRKATEIPMSTAEKCLWLLRTAARVKELGTRSAWSDVSVASDLAYAGAMGGLANVRTNLEQRAEDDYSRDMRAKAERTAAEAGKARRLVEEVE